MVVHKMTDNGTAESSGVPELFARTAHLTDEHAAFLRKWDRIVDLEAAEYVREQPWLHTSMEQEKRGRCLADMVLEKQEVSGGAYLYHFRKRVLPLDAASPMSQSSRTSLLDLFEAARGDFVSLSTEDGHYGVARGSIAELSPQYVVVALDDELRVLPRSLDENSNAAMSNNGNNGGNVAEPAPLEGLLDVERVFDCLTPGSPVRASHHYRSRARLREALAKPQVWRIDREDLVSTEVRMHAYGVLLAGLGLAFLSARARCATTLRCFSLPPSPCFARSSSISPRRNLTLKPVMHASLGYRQSRCVCSMGTRSAPCQWCSQRSTTR